MPPFYEKDPAKHPKNAPDPTHIWTRSKCAPGLYVAATPIGNLRDITLRALDTLASVDVIFCEDTRIARTLTAHYGIKTPLKVYNDHAADDLAGKVARDIGEGSAIALISDAGTPLISDPGYRLVRAVQDAGGDVFTIPGPSAVTAGLSIAGCPTDKFLFVGFLPPKTVARQKALNELKALPFTLILYETARRIQAMWADLADIFDGRDAVILRELTKLHEQTTAAPIAELQKQLGTDIPLKGEFVIILPPTDEKHEDVAADIDAELADLLRSLPTKAAATLLKEKFGISKSEAYQQALDVKNADTENGG